MALRTEFAAALNQAAAERGLDPQEVVSIVKDAIKAAYRKDYGGELEELDAEIDAETGEAKVFKDGKDVTPEGFGRIAAQTAKQVLLQRIREAEKGAIFAEYEKKIGNITNGMIQRIEGPNVVVDLGKTEAIMPAAERITGEDHRLNQRLKFYIVGIKESSRGQDIIVSRAHKGLVEGLFKLEVPEIGSNIVEIKAISREAGARSKVAVSSRQVGVDPVGSCVGQKGVRVQAVIAELGNEKIDVISYSDDPAKFVAAALSPATVDKVSVDAETKTAHVEVPEDQLSLAIGKDGQNVRLAAKLTGWRIDIKGAGLTGVEDEEKKEKKEKPPKKVAKKAKAKKATTKKPAKKPVKKIAAKKTIKTKAIKE
ncbi:MAG: transcription termination factor NusA [Candidatus Woykebacteria bacterium RIFCSPHIGHO2_12_FULL_45_10]|uniref:Transcription termination/antitermination protein NusA n=1 Tax=Candidatus Woykebacteria bacterium RIFCSPHIGHO2_12_FULL_45_10 TaxID=1802603 RepID=A0A1G1WRQ5_9BACT|nr:MAG: transcription termination factor NusA [Candidatus Woykebacteria bacterium RIFCSPHIGHO2_12_FULL_45_10]